jgi:hypothetical protein
MKEAKGDGLPGFQKKWTASASSRRLSDEDLLSYEDFRHVVYKWHVNLTKVSNDHDRQIRDPLRICVSAGFRLHDLAPAFLTITPLLSIQAFTACLESKEYMQIRNALLMLTKIIDYFPIVRKLASSIEEVVAKLKEDEREDLKVLATRYHAMLSTKKSSWIAEELFHLVKSVNKPPTSMTQTPANVTTMNLARAKPLAILSSSSKASGESLIVSASPTSSITTPGDGKPSLVSEPMTSTQAAPIETKKRPNQQQISAIEGKCYLFLINRPIHLSSPMIMMMD